MSNRRPQDVPPKSQHQSSQFQFRNRTSSQSHTAQQQRQTSEVNNSNKRGFPFHQRMPLPSGQQSSNYNRVLAAGDSGISSGSVIRNVPESGSVTSRGTYNQNSGSAIIPSPNQRKNERPSTSYGRSGYSPVPVTTNSNDFDFDDDVWGDDDDDMDMVMASQAVEATTSVLPATTKAVTSGYVYSSQPRSILNQNSVTRDRGMPLHMIRYELALKESTSNGEEVRMEDFMPGGVLGGVIAPSSTFGEPKKEESSAEEIMKLKKINTELKSENYSCKGEVANLRRLLDKHVKERMQETMNRLTQDRNNQKKEKEVKDKTAKEYEKLKTDLRFSQNEVRTLGQKLEEYKKLAESYRLSSSPTTNSLNTSISNLNLSNSKNSSISFPNRSTFSAREISTPTQTQLPIPLPIASVKKDSKTIEVQTDQTLRPETANDLAQKTWLSMEKYREEILSICSELITVKTIKNTALLLPVFECIAEKAQNEIIRNLKNEGFPYEFMFPDNLKLAEFKLDEKERTCHNEIQLDIPKFPNEHMDWDGIAGLDGTIWNFLRDQKDIWAGISYIGNDFVQRINFIRHSNPNSLYRPKNLVHFMKLLLWGKNLWKNFHPEFCEHWRRRKEPRQFFLEDIRKWTASMLWIGNRCFEVRDVRLELRKLVLKTLVSLTSNACFNYTEANYLGVYKFIFYTLTLSDHLNFGNFYNCLKLSGSLGRKKFYLKYMCTNKNDASCLAFQFAVKCLQFFKNEKDVTKKFKIYKAYLDLLVAMREWCVVHSACGSSEEPLQADDPGDSVEHPNPVFLVPKKKVKEVPVQTNPCNESEVSRIDLGVNSFYLYGSEVMDSSALQVHPNDDSQTIFNPGAATDCDNPGPSKLLCKSTKSGPISESEFQFKRPRLPPPSCRPSVHWNFENGDDAASTGCSTKAIHGSAANLSSFEDLEGVNASRGSANMKTDIVEDEWDATEQEALTLKMTSEVGSKITTTATSNSVSNDNLPCRKFLDCSLWEEMKNSPKVGYCQCRFHLMETFMLMTEEIVKIWRFLKIRSEYKKSKVALDNTEAEDREEEFENLLEKTRSVERDDEKKTSVARSDDDFQDDHFISPDSVFWKRLIRDTRCSPCKLTPECAGQTLETAVDIMSNTYMTTQYNTFTAFGSDGANAFLVASSYLLHYLTDLNFCSDTERLVHYISSSDSVGLGPRGNPPELELMEGSNYHWAKNIFAQTERQRVSHKQRNPSGLSSFHLKFDLETIPKFNPTSRAVTSKMPPLVLKSLLLAKRRKSEVRNLNARNTDYPSGEKTVRHEQRAVAVDRDIGMINLCDSPEPDPLEEENNVENKTTSSSESDCEFEDDRNFNSDGWVTTDDSDVHSDGDTPIDKGEGDPSVLPPKSNPNYKTVDDYKSFCVPSIEDGKKYSEVLYDSEFSDEREFLDFSQLSTSFRNEKKTRKILHTSNETLFPKFKSARKVCDELRNAINLNLKNPELEDVIVEVENLDGPGFDRKNSVSDMKSQCDNDIVAGVRNVKLAIQNMMATINRPKYYYEDETLGLWDDYNVDPLSIDV